MKSIGIYFSILHFFLMSCNFKKTNNENIKTSTNLCENKESEKPKCVLNVNQNSIRKKEDYYIVTTSLINCSEKTIHFLSMSCLWQSFYFTDNSDLEIKLPMCDKNVFIEVSLAPKEVKDVELLIKSKSKKIKSDFKIGFLLMSTKNLYTEEFNYEEELKKGKIIWSNRICV